MFGLTKRLEAIYNGIPDVEVVADIGTDHGLLAVSLIEGKKAKKVIASDVHQGPLMAASSYIAKKGYLDCIETRLGNGLQVLQPNEAEAVVCCGMGGFLIVELLKAAPYLPKYLILQPQSGIANMRQFVYGLGYRPIVETALEDMGHYYTMNTWVQDATISSPYDHLASDDIQWEWGALLVEQQDRLLYKKLCELIEIDKSVLMQLENVDSDSALSAKKRVEKRLLAMQQVLNKWEELDDQHR